MTGMTLEKAAEMITQQIEKVNPDLIKEEPEDKSLIPFHIQEQLHQQYSVMAQEMNQSIASMEKRLEARDETLMKTLREMQEFRDEVTQLLKRRKSRGIIKNL